MKILISIIIIIIIFCFLKSLIKFFFSFLFRFLLQAWCSCLVAVLVDYYDDDDNYNDDDEHLLNWTERKTLKTCNYFSIYWLGIFFLLYRFSCLITIIFCLYTFVVVLFLVFHLFPPFFSFWFLIRNQKKSRKSCPYTLYSFSTHRI